MNEQLASQFSWLKTLAIGGGSADMRHGLIRLTLPPTPAARYADAQVDDYHNLRRRHFPWRPPLRMTLRARMSHPSATSSATAATGAHLRGTAGFGFWNNPFTLSGGGVVAAPSVVWFFYASPPSDMALVEGVPGWGWKAAALDSARLPGFVLAPAALVAVLLTKVPGLGRPVMTVARGAMRVSERQLPVDMTSTHTYRLEWGEREAGFYVDDELAMRAPDPPRGPLGFVAWLDNQYAIATPQGRFGFGVVETTEPQWMELESIDIIPTRSGQAV